MSVLDDITSGDISDRSMSVDEHIRKTFTPFVEQRFEAKRAELEAKFISDNGVPGNLYDTIYAKGQREALRAVQHAIDDIEIMRGAKVPRALKDAVRKQLESLPPVYDSPDA